MKHNVECTYRPLKQSRKKQRRANKEDLLHRLNHYEAILEKEGLDVELPPKPEVSQPLPRSILPHDGEWRAYPSTDHDSTQILTPKSRSSDINPDFNRKQIIPGRQRSEFVDNSLMSRVAEEFSNDNGDDASEGSSSEEEGEHIEDSFDILTGVSGSGHHVHPTYALDLWQVYVDNVDPIVKILHVPSLHASFQRAVGELVHIPKSFEALIWAICSTAVLSLKDGECQQRYGQERQALLSYCIAGTKHSLARADFTRSTNIVVLQALVLHIISIRDDAEPRSIWVMSGVGLRLARGIGIHRDAKSLGIPPFEAEMRRRLWCYISMLDNRSAEMCGQPKFQNLDGIPEPLANVDDKDIFPGMTESPASSPQATDMVFFAIQSEFFVFASQMSEANRKHLGASSADNFAEVASVLLNKDVIGQFQDMLETKYLRYLDPSNPLHFLATLFARHSMNVGRFMSNHPRRWKSREDMPEAQRNLVWNVSCKLLEQFDMIQSSRHVQKYAWNFKYYLQWHALIHVLDVLRTEPKKADAYKAWQLIGVTFNNNPAIITDKRRTLYVAVGNLCIRAWAAREASHPSGSTHSVPQYIADLRQRRGNKEQKSKKTNPSAMKIGVTALATEAQPTALQVASESVQGFSYTPSSNFWFDGWNGMSFADQPNPLLPSSNFSPLDGDALNFESQQIDWNAWDNLLAEAGSRNQSNFAI